MISPDAITGTNRFYRFLAVAVILAAILAGCGVQKPLPPEIVSPALNRLDPDSYPTFGDDMALDGMVHAVAQSLVYLRRLPSDRVFQFGEDRYGADHMIRSLEAFIEFLATFPNNREISGFIRSNYRVYRAVGRTGAGRVLFTGYYEPYLRGSLERRGDYIYPVYARPDDLISIDLSLFSSRFQGERIMARIEGDRVLPYHDRQTISGSDLLADKADVLAWVDDRVDLFFLHIQGSGKIFLDTGATLNVHYAAANGRPYRSIGRLLIDEGKIDQADMSMQNIRSYLKAHPEELERILSHNPSYVFFQNEPDGPLGSLGVRLTPGRSIATDSRIFPRGALAFINTQKPLVSGRGEIAGWTELFRFALNQDTGGAIQGPGRADLFWGNGDYAEIAAGHLQHPGRLYFLVLDPDGPIAARLRPGAVP